MASGPPWPVLLVFGGVFLWVGLLVARKALEQFARAHRLVTTEVVDAIDVSPGGTTLRFRQAVLVPGQEAFVLGEATTDESGPATETVIDGAADPGSFAVSNERGGSPLKNIAFGVFLGWFALAGTGAGGLLLYLLATQTLGL